MSPRTVRVALVIETDVYDPRHPHEIARAVADATNLILPVHGHRLRVADVEVTE